MVHYRTIWISDVHLGMRHVRTDALLDFLRRHECEHLYIVGDLIDGWRLRKSWYWDEDCNTVIQKLLRKARHGTRVTYVPGNHDEFVRSFVGLHFGGIRILPEAIHETADGRRLVVIHGDEFDGLIGCAKWLSVMGSGVYSMALRLNQGINAVRRRLGFSYWSLAGFLKSRAKTMVLWMANFEQLVLKAAERHGADGVICGHVHQPDIQEIGGIAYYNTGDWVESCTALVEHVDGSMELLYWGAASTTQGPARPLVSTAA